jgi:hypothetical protein
LSQLRDDFDPAPEIRCSAKQTPLWTLSQMQCAGSRCVENNFCHVILALL